MRNRTSRVATFFDKVINYFLISSFDGCAGGCRLRCCRTAEGHGLALPIAGSRLTVGGALIADGRYLLNFARRSETH
jgi:hypothetical protein